MNPDAVVVSESYCEPAITVRVCEPIVRVPFCAYPAATAGTAGASMATAVAAAARLSRERKLGPGDELVLCITGNGLKTVEAVQPALGRAPVIDPKLREVAALVNATR